MTCKLLAFFEVTHEAGHITGGEVRGSLFDWQLALTEAEVDLQNNLPLAMRIAGMIGVPFIPDTLFDVEFGLRPPIGSNRYQQTMSIRTTDAMNIPVIHGSVSCASLSVSGDLGADYFSLAGSITQLHIDIQPLRFDVASAAVHLSHSPTDEGVEIHLGHVPLGHWEKSKQRY